MANYINNQNSIVRAGKFVENGRDTGSTRSNLKHLINAINGNANESSVSIVTAMTSDSVITPEEKAQLYSEWQSIRKGYETITSNASKLGLLDTEEYRDITDAYNRVKFEIENVLASMSTSSNVDMSFNEAFENYSRSASNFNSFISVILSGSVEEAWGYEYRISVYPPAFTASTESIAITASIYYKGEDVTDDITNDERYISTKPEGDRYYPKLFQWHFIGTKSSSNLEEKFSGMRIATVKPSDLESASFSVRCSGVLSI